MVIRDSWFQFFKFGLVGALNTVIGLVSYYVFIIMGFHYMIANVLSWLISVFNAFYWNNKYVFKNNLSWWRALIKTYISYGLSFVFSAVLLFIFVEYVEISEVVAPIAILTLTIPVNFFMNKYWTFKSR